MTPKLGWNFASSFDYDAHAERGLIYNKNVDGMAGHEASQLLILQKRSSSFDSNAHAERGLKHNIKFDEV